MPHETFTLRSPMPVSAEELYAWHARPAAFPRLVPPWEKLTVIGRQGNFGTDGMRVTFRAPWLGPLRRNWVVEFFDFEPGRGFKYRLLDGPFPEWVHTHRMIPDGPDRSFLDNRIEYRLPLGAFGAAFGSGPVQDRVEALFAYRHALTASDLRRHAHYRNRPRMKVAITGSRGLVGTDLALFLATGGHSVKRLVTGKNPIATQGDGAALREGEAHRKGEAPAEPSYPSEPPTPGSAGASPSRRNIAVAGAFCNATGKASPSAYDDGTQPIPWEPQAPLDPAVLDGCDAVVHLAADPIAEGRWTEAKRKKIIESRTIPTRHLAEAIAALPAERRPRVLLSASAVGIYGDRGDEILTEDSPPGSGFLADVCKVWEEATAPAIDAGVRVVHLRIGVVLSPRGGALGKQLPAFRAGAGAVLGSGKQWVPWIINHDLVGAIHHCLMTDSLSGPVNLEAPNAVTNREFTKTLGRVLWRPAVMWLPRAALKAMFGDIADAALLASMRAVPRKLLESGFAFDHADLEAGLRFLLGRP